MRPVEFLFSETGTSPTLKLEGENCWGMLDADIGYYFANRRWGLFLAFNRSQIKIEQLGIEPSVYSHVVRTTLATTGKYIILGKPASYQLYLSGGPSLNMHHFRSPYQGNKIDTEQSLGVVLGSGFIVPNRFTSLLIRANYIWANDYKAFNTSGLSISLGVELN